jgi:hypothetical protein
MMTFKHPLRLLMLQFLGRHRQMIKETFLQHRSQDGYVFLRADRRFEAVEGPRFVQREFDTEDFSPVDESGGNGPESEEGLWMYYEVYWEHDRSSWRFKEPVNERGLE